MAQHPPNTPAGEAERIARSQDVDSTPQGVVAAVDNDRALVEAAGLGKGLPKPGKAFDPSKFGELQDQIAAHEAKLRILKAMAPGGPEYPKVVYRAADAATVLPPIESRTVHSKEEEDALKGDWGALHDVQRVEIEPLPVGAPLVAKLDTPDSRAVDDAQAERHAGSKGGAQ